MTAHATSTAYPFAKLSRFGASLTPVKRLADVTPWLVVRALGERVRDGASGLFE